MRIKFATITKCLSILSFKSTCCKRTLRMFRPYRTAEYSYIRPEVEWFITPKQTPIYLLIVINLDSRGNLIAGKFCFKHWQTGIFYSHLECHKKLFFHNPLQGLTDSLALIIWNPVEHVCRKSKYCKACSKLVTKVSQRYIISAASLDIYYEKYMNFCEIFAITEWMKSNSSHLLRWSYRRFLIEAVGFQKLHRRQLQLITKIKQLSQAGSI